MGDTTTPFLSKPYDVKLHPDVKYGIGGIGFGDSGATAYRDLTLDIYEPAADGKGLRPAMILAFGGAFQRGSKTDDIVVEGEHRNTPISEYCREFARRGYVCCSIDYRLLQEAPDPGVTPTLPPDTPINLDRINYVRDLLGLPPATPQMMADEMEAATDDMTSAVGFVRARAHALRIDVNRLAVGGFSAGAVMALNSAFAEAIPVAAVVALSGRISLATAKAHVTGRPGQPAVQMFFGQHDLPGILEDAEASAAHLNKMGIAIETAHVEGATHFYPRTAAVTARDGSRSDVESVMAEFLYRQLRLRDLAG
jgi:acetyl esterase/lipase